MQNKRILQFFLVLTISLISCTKEDVVYDEDIPNIKVQSPQGQSIYAAGDTIDIHVLIIDNDELHEIGAILTAESNGANEVIWETSTHSHQASFDLYYRLIVPLSANHIDYKLEVTASDHHENIGRKVFTFHAM